MLLRLVPASAFGTNCWVIARDRGDECVIVDPGFGVLEGVADVLREDGLKPAAVLLTHAHVDHVWSAAPTARHFTAGPIGVHVHSGDRYRMSDPLATLGPALRAALESQSPALVWDEPDDLVDLAAAAGAESTLTVAGTAVGVRHTPGHTEGSVVFRLAGAGDGGEDVLLTGDLLFAGSIGRTDLVGGDDAAMRRSLVDVMTAYDDRTAVLPGHGPVTTVGLERGRNPHLPPEVREGAPGTVL